jgi:hypothetical protein
MLANRRYEVPTEPTTRGTDGVGGGRAEKSGKERYRVAAGILSGGLKWMAYGLRNVPNAETT